MKNNEIVRALRCISTAGGENACEHCPYWKEEEVPDGPYTEPTRCIHAMSTASDWMARI